MFLVRRSSFAFGPFVLNQITMCCSPIDCRVPQLGPRIDDTLTVMEKNIAKMKVLHIADSVATSCQALLHPSSLGPTKKYSLQKNLQQAWSKRCRVFFHKDQPRIKPGIATDSFEPKPCFLLGLCVCGKYPGSSPEALHFWRQLVVCLKPVFAKARKQEKSHERLLLEDKMLVFRFRSGPPHSVPQDAEEAEEGSPQEREATEHVEYIHVGYVNFSSWHFSCLRVHEVTDATAWGVPASIQVMVQSDAEDVGDKWHGVFTDIQFASRFLDLSRSCFLQVYCISLSEDLWQKQDTSSKLVPLVPLSGFDEMKIWRGWEFEKHEMQRLSKEKRKKTASDMPIPRAKKARVGGPARPGLRAEGAEPQQQPSEVDVPALEGVEEQQHADVDINEEDNGYADEDRDDDEDEDEQQGYWLQEVASPHSSSSREPEDFDEEDQRESEDDGGGVGAIPDIGLEVADVHVADLGDELWEEMRRDFADAPGLAAPEPRAGPALARGFADVFELPGLGDIRFYADRSVLQAKCTNPEHGDCRITRTTQPHPSNPARHTARGGQGRPLGFLSAWLQAQFDFPDQASHCHRCKPTYEARCESRSFFVGLEGGQAWSDRVERARDTDAGEDVEPRVIR